MLEAMVNGLKLVMTLPVLGLMLIATLIGNFFGAVPGLGGSLALALMIPFVFGMEPFLGLAFLLSMHSVVHTGGSIPGILFAIPGTGPTVATILDGYPMTQQGRGGEAMGAQLTASALGGIVGAAVLAFLIPVLRPIAISFGSPEIFALIGPLGSGKTHLIKGIAAGAGAAEPGRVNSPTFVYLNIYDGPKSVYHFDLYRLGNSADFLAQGFEEYFSADGVCCIEWSERIEEILPEDHVAIHIKHLGENKREIWVN